MSHIQCAKIVKAGKFKVFEYMTAPEKLAEQLSGIINVEWQNPGVPLTQGAEFLFLMSRFGIEQPVRIRIDKMVVGNSLTYQQVSGLFMNFTHTIKFEEHSPGATLVTDLVEYEIPFGLLGRLADDFLIRSDLRKILAHRLDRVAEHFENESNGDSPTPSPNAP